MIPWRAKSMGAYAKVNVDRTSEGLPEDIGQSSRLWAQYELDARRDFESLEELKAEGQIDEQEFILLLDARDLLD